MQNFERYGIFLSYKIKDGGGGLILTVSTETVIVHFKFYFPGVKCSSEHKFVGFKYLPAVALLWCFDNLLETHIGKGGPGGMCGLMYNAIIKFLAS